MDHRKFISPVVKKKRALVAAKKNKKEQSGQAVTRPNFPPVRNAGAVGGVWMYTPTGPEGKEGEIEPATASSGASRSSVVLMVATVVPSMEQKLKYNSEQAQWQEIHQQKNIDYGHWRLAIATLGTLQPTGVMNIGVVVK
ncbi:hypothetical protein SARC_04698 [Sphaeroforma arctica JP610]|uniref:Uncharacterized protein n=1 Tax=Sphaeroforma arctica JP610 TaxID=667725 RepID=A0A0L0G1K8_9EUKA|nr:hypothetical protein SARC_04698 [Sphaeroforma arctica JP610]KNC83027.1 hypothetical protein SARC_04698 [Sphaeroforma arctica JP610]|eukprot:XP_014156929.1 hypothetical protein SARC_04698 [Sphaeroforma arctica JP610]